MEISLTSPTAAVNPSAFVAETNPISISVTAGAITSTPIYARLKAGLAIGTYADAATKVIASVTGASFTSKEVQFTGTVSATVSGTQNISDLALSGAATLNIIAGGELNINQNTSSVTINVQPGGKVTLADTKVLTGSTLTLQSNASGTASFIDSRADVSTAIAGTVEQVITATNRNWYVAVPVTGKVASEITLSGASIVKRNEVAATWDPVSAGTALTAGVGYIAVASTSSGNATWTLAGNLQSGNVDVSVTRSGTGFNLLGNPYPSYLNWEQVLNLNATNASRLQPTIWYRTAAYNEAQSKYDYTFNTYNSIARVATPTTTTGYIPPMQAFWVKANNAGTVTFTNEMRSHGNGSSNMLKAPTANSAVQPLVRLQIANATSNDETVLYFNADASNAFDKYDSQKMFEIEDALKPEIFTQIGNEKLVINGLNTIPYDTEIPLGLVTKQVGNFSIGANELLNFESGTRVILKDKLNPAIETELTPETVYNFNAPITAASTDRFSLIFRAPGVTTGSNNIGNVKTQVFVNAANQITIVAPEKSSYSIYNAVGQLVENGRITSNSQTSNFKLSVGVYVVRVNNQSTRVIVK
jgi:hypothetical protein